MSYKGPKAKKSRSLGVPLTPKAAVIMEKRPAPPGQHGAKRRNRSDFGAQLLQKQRLKFQYNVSERQLRRYYLEAKRQKGSTGERLIQILESRLDNVVYRSGFAATIYAARQLVGHGHVQINGRKANIPSQLVSPNEVIGLREKSRGLLVVKDALSRANRPSYIEVDLDKLEAKQLRKPESIEVPIVCNLQAVVEYFSR
jgi:small subunit ribosomal protein S4